MNFRGLCLLTSFVALICLPACVATGGAADTTTAANPIDAAFQEELEAFYAEHQFPGATAAFVLNDGHVGVAAVGASDLDTSSHMTSRSRMLAASVGKSFVGAAVIALAQEGVISLDDPISKWLGDRTWFNRLANNEAITVHHLLTHSAGIPDHVYMEDFAAAFGTNWAAPGNPIPPSAAVEFILDQPALFEAGAGWSYSDTGYVLLGMIVEEVSDHSLHDEIIDRFLVPLGLELTTPSNLRIIPGLATGYMSADNTFGLPSRTTIAPGIMAWNPALEWAGGGFASTSRDLAVWAKALYEGRAMEGEYLESLMRAAPIGGEGSGASYGAGVTIKENGPLGVTYGHAGGIPGYTSSMRYYPEHGIAVAFQINADGGIADESSPVGEYLEELENRLAEALILAKHD